MAFHLFAPKTLGSIGIGSGVLGGGGVIYWYQVPTTWRGLLVKEGYLFLSEEYDYKGMFEDQKETSEWKSEASVSDATETDVKSKVETYCKKLDDVLPSSSEANYDSTKKKLIAFCTSDGIRTVKSRIVQSKKSTSGLNWIADSEADKWKAVFAVYRYEPEFIAWLKADNKDANKNLSKDSTVDDGYTKLKDACGKLLKSDHRGVSEVHVKYGSWWCVELGYKTIKEKITATDADWVERPDNDQNWDSLKTKWENTDQVKKWANKANGGTDDQTSDLTVDSLKKLCGSDYVNAQLSENDSYQEKYVVIKSVCKKDDAK